MIGKKGSKEAQWYSPHGVGQGRGGANKLHSNKAWPGGGPWLWTTMGLAAAATNERSKVLGKRDNQTGTTGKAERG